MINYWLRHRLFFSVVFVLSAVLIVGLVAVHPYISGQANEYNAQSVYKNTMIDFIAPDPSFTQVSELADSKGIKRIFPFYATKANVSVKGRTRSSQVLLSDQFENLDLTMYNETRLIRKSDVLFDNPVLVDWQFCRDTSANIGDEVTLPLGKRTEKYIIYAIYETNEIYDGGAILVRISTADRDDIAQNSKSKGYSGMYIAASNYSECRTYLTTEYRPLGRLKDKELFDSDESYSIHYHAIMDSGYSNEITDMRVKESGLKTDQKSSLLWIGSAIAFLLFMVFNIVMSKRDCEWGYFSKYCIPSGLNVKPFYICSFFSEIVLFISLFYLSLQVIVHSGEQFIPFGIIDTKLAVIPAAIVVAEIIGIGISVANLSHSTRQPITNESDSDSASDQNSISSQLSSSVGEQDGVK